MNVDYVNQGKKRLKKILLGIEKIKRGQIKIKKEQQDSKIFIYRNNFEIYLSLDKKR